MAFPWNYELDDPYWSTYWTDKFFVYLTNKTRYFVTHLSTKNYLEYKFWYDRKFKVRINKQLVTVNDKESCICVCVNFLCSTSITAAVLKSSLTLVLDHIKSKPCFIEAKTYRSPIISDAMAFSVPTAAVSLWKNAWTIKMFKPHHFQVPL